MPQAQKKYEHLHAISRNAALFEGIFQLLEWDQETYMPLDAGNIRGEQLQAMAGHIHQKKTNREFTDALSQLIDLETGEVCVEGLSTPQRAALKRWRRDYRQAIALPSAFVEEFARLCSQSQLVWRQAKIDNSFPHFAPFLDKIISMNRKKADLLGYDEHPYDALLDLYEPENSKHKISAIFSQLKDSLAPLLKRIAESKQIENEFLFGHFEPQKQMEFSRLLLDAMGYTPTRGRLDLSSHPFSSSVHPTDSRVTTRLHKRSLMSCILSVLHEGGHALYEMGLPLEQYGSPLGQAISLGMHESQSRWWETRIGQSKPFWQHHLPLLKRHFPTLEPVSLDDFYRAINRVQPSLIRVEADEVTYPLHVILRTEIECGLIEGSISVRDLPDVWNAKMQELVGIAPANNREGCLQDVHWSMGAFGYFPTYVLGNLYAAHLFTAFNETHPDWEVRVAAGDLLYIKSWLHEAVHKYGRQYNSFELLKESTGREFSALAYTDYLQSKYHEIYQLP